MIETIKPIMTIDELYARGGEPTGDTLLDAVVKVMIETQLLEGKHVAKLLDVPERKLSGAMELLMGLSLSQLIHEWRFRQACQLLKETELPLDEVAQKCGFGNSRPMNLVFKKRLNTTLYQYRYGHPRTMSPTAYIR